MEYEFYVKSEKSICYIFLFRCEHKLFENGHVELNKL